MTIIISIIISMPDLNKEKRSVTKYIIQPHILRIIPSFNGLYSEADTAFSLSKRNTCINISIYINLSVMRSRSRMLEAIVVITVFCSGKEFMTLLLLFSIFTNSGFI
jgi:hypothetical protein